MAKTEKTQRNDTISEPGSMPAAEQFRASPERDKAIELALAGIEKQFGKGAIMRLGEVSSRMHIEAIPTGAIALDLALGVGGVPRGRVVAIIDAEHAFDPVFAQNVCGVNVPELLISQPDTGEQALEICEMLVRSAAVDVVVVDSVAALTPRAEIEGDMGDSLPGLQARLMSQALRKLTAAISRSRTAVIFINQLREKIGIIFGNPETTPGGRALKFYSAVRIDLRRVESLKQAGTVIGSRVKAKIVKNKVAPPFRTAEFDMIFTGARIGISREGDIVDLAADSGIVKKQGAFYSYGEQRLGQGREQAKDYLRENPDLAQDLEAQIRAKSATTPQPVSVHSGLEGEEGEPS